jgi:hypothetical protein
MGPEKYSVQLRRYSWLDRETMDMGVSGDPVLYKASGIQRACEKICGA